jgi:sec-independent protein translocase protein TatA
MGIGIWELVLLLVIVLVIFGTKRLRNIGGDLGGAIRSFRGAMSETDAPPKADAGSIEDEKTPEKKDQA